MSRDGGNGYKVYVFEESTRRCAIDCKGRGRKEVIYLRVADVSCTQGNVFHHSSGNTSHPAAPKTTKSQKNCTLISQQRLNNKFQNPMLSLSCLFRDSYSTAEVIYSVVLEIWQFSSRLGAKTSIS